MPHVTQLLVAAAAGDTKAAAELLPLVYDELRKLATAKLAVEKPGQTLQATALVHEAYLRLVGNDADSPWNSRGHFFAAAAEAMRRILVDAARRKKAIKHGGKLQRVDLDDMVTRDLAPPEEILDLDEILNRLQDVDPLAARLVELRYFAGFSMEQAANALGISVRTAERNWTFARAWLYRELSDRSSAEGR